MCPEPAGRPVLVRRVTVTRRRAVRDRARVQCCRAGGGIDSRREAAGLSHPRGLGSAASLDQRDASGGVRNEDVAQAIAAAATESMKFVGDLGDEPGSGSHVHDVGMQYTIMAAAADLVGPASVR